MFGWGKKPSQKTLPPTWQGKTDLAEKSVDQMGAELVGVVAKTISIKDWLSEVKPMNDQQKAAAEKKDQQKTGEELNKIRNKLSPRPVEREMEEVRAKKKEEEEKEERMLAQVRAQREREAEERRKMMTELPSNPHKRKKKRGSALAVGKQSKPSQDQMTQTGEFTQKPE